MSRRAKIGEEGCTPLRNKRHEAFAQARVNMSIPDAWAASLPSGAKRPARNSLKAAGWKVEKRPEVQRRIAFLRKGAEAARREIEVDVLRRRDIATISLEVTDALERAFDAASRAAVPATKLEALRRVLGAHIGRQGKLTEQDGVAPEEPATEALDGIRRLEEWEPCRCRQR